MICAVLNCKNNENSLNKNNKISFHRFPIKDEYRTLWIKATGRGANWIPSKTDCLCSEHFKPTFFHIRRKIPFLNGRAVPTLNCTVSSSLNLSNATPEGVPCNKEESVCKAEEFSDIEPDIDPLSIEQHESDEEEMDVYIECDETSSNNSTFKQTINSSRLDTIDDQLVEIEFKIAQQNRQIKHLLQRQRRHNARLPSLRDQIVNLNKSNETVCTNLENLGFPIVSEILSRIILCDRNEVNDSENPYSEAFEIFIVTLYSISPAAYNMIQTKFPVGVFPDESLVKNNCSILENQFSEDL